MRPGDDPDFFRRADPDGLSRESSIRLDPHGCFWHAGERVNHPRLSAALHSWIRRHPESGRYILSNGYDWAYFTVDDAPYNVKHLRIDNDEVELILTDGTSEPFQAEGARVGTDGALYVQVKRHAPCGPFEAKFSRHAQGALAPLLVEIEARGVGIRLGGTLFFL